jgi:hypothetical protein
MTTRRGEIGMGDALRAARELELNRPEDFEILVEVLGLRRTPPARSHWSPEDRPPVEGGRKTAGSAQELTDEAISGRRKEGSHTTAETLEPEPVSAISYQTAELLSPGPVGAGAVPYEPPVPLHQLRAALSILLRRPRPSNRLNVDAAVDIIAEQRPLTHVPRLLEQTLDAGVTVVADIGTTMLPYLDDVAQLVEEVRNIAGGPVTEVVWTQDGSDLPRLNADRPIMIISTLGAVRPPGSPPGLAATWRSLAAQLARNGADSTALVPHRQHRWPMDLVAAARLVAWDDLPDVGRGHA